MDNNQIIANIFLYNALLRSVAFVCITVAAVHFESTSILWWYILPGLMGLTTKEAS